MPLNRLLLLLLTRGGFVVDILMLLYAQTLQLDDCESHSRRLARLFLDVLGTKKGSPSFEQRTPIEKLWNSSRRSTYRQRFHSYKKF